MKRTTLFGLIVLVMVICVGAFFFSASHSSSASGLPIYQTTIHGKPVKLEIASQEKDLQQGLGDRASIPKDHGMLFVFSVPSIQSFWMRHMKFPIDIIYLYNGVVTEIAEDMPAPDQTLGIPKTYTPTYKADMVLELNSDGTDAYQINVGDQLINTYQVQALLDY